MTSQHNPPMGSGDVTLRDYFAGQWLTTFNIGPGATVTIGTLAADCYRMADAMLAERAKP